MSICNYDHELKLPKDLINVINNVYQPAGMKITKKPLREVESSEYEACRFCLDGYSIVFRVAKTTPNKIGQFVTLWKRPIPQGIIAPLDNQDDVDFVVINTSNTHHCGQFIFNKKILIEQNIISLNNKGGK